MRDAKSPLSSHIEGFLAAKRIADKTRHDYASYLRKFNEFTGGVSLEEALTVDNVVAWVSNLRAHGPFAARNGYMAVKSFATWAAKMRYTATGILAGVEGPQVPGTSRHALSDEQLDAIWQALEDFEYEHDRIRARAYLWLLYATGLRKNEARQLALADLHIDAVAHRSWVHVRWQTSKGSKERKVRLDRAAVPALEAYISNARPEFRGARNRPEPLFLTAWGLPFTEHGFGTFCDRLFNKVEAATGIDVSSHWYRHTWATQYHRASRDTGLTVYDLKQEGGWADLNTPMRYTHERPFEELLDHPTAITALQKRRMAGTA